MDEDENRGRYHNSNSEDPIPAEQPDTEDIAATNFRGYQSKAENVQSKRDEEFASEVTAEDSAGPIDSDESDGRMHSAYGWIGLVLSIISFFMMPIILGGAGIILGFVSRSRGADTLGNTAIIAGAISVLFTLFLLPFV